MTDEELSAIEKACGCGIDHSTGYVGECDVPALLAEVKRLRALITKAADGAEGKDSSWEFRGEDWRSGYKANGRMVAEFLRFELDRPSPAAVRARGK